MTPRFNDDFAGNDGKLLDCIDALLSMDASGNLVPHGIGGHARKMLSAAAARIEAAAFDNGHAAGFRDGARAALAKPSRGTDHG